MWQKWHLRLKKVPALWKSASPNHRRLPSTMHDSLNRSRRRYFHLWIIALVVLVLAYYYVFYIHRHDDVDDELPSEMKNIDFSKLQTGEVPCGRNCNFDALSEKMKEKFLDTFKTNPDGLLPCEVNVLKLGLLQVNTTLIQVNLTRSLYPQVRLGGHYVPSDCLVREKVAVIVPYRDEEALLNVFIFNIHPFLMNQGIEYRLFIIEQTGYEKFNKGRLFNAGYQQAGRFGSWPCLVFHELDIVPLDARIQYSCPTFPRHMSPTVLGHEDELKYQKFGGVTSMTEEHFRKVNGYSNNFWGCCGLSSDMFKRIRLRGLQVVKYDKKIAKYLALTHAPVKRNHAIGPPPEPPQRGNADQKTYPQGGLTTVRYKVVNIRLRALFTHIKVDVNPSPKEWNIYKHKELEK